jgi:hypothetical protein
MKHVFWPALLTLFLINCNLFNPETAVMDDGDDLPLLEGTYRLEHRLKVVRYDSGAYTRTYEKTCSNTDSLIANYPETWLDLTFYDNKISGTWITNYGVAFEVPHPGGRFADREVARGSDRFLEPGLHDYTETIAYLVEAQNLYVIWEKSGRWIDIYRIDYMNARPVDTAKLLEQGPGYEGAYITRGFICPGDSVCTSDTFEVVKDTVLRETGSFLLNDNKFIEQEWNILLQLPDKHNAAIKYITSYYADYFLEYSHEDSIAKYEIVEIRLKEWIYKKK